MKLHLAATAGLNTFTGYGEGYVLVNDRRHERSVIVLPDRIVTEWPATTFEALTADDIGPLVELAPEIVLLGTGTRLRFPPAAVLAPLVRARIGFEVMDVQAACRTYNILAAEERKVAAALLLA